MDNTLDIKNQINKIHQSWLAVDDSLDDFKDAEYYESNVVDLLVKYCRENKYTINGFPFLHEELAESNEDLDSEYFSERYELYLYSVANEKEDVFELLHFYWNLFWPDSIETIEDTRNSIDFEIKVSEFDFEV